MSANAPTTFYCFLYQKDRNFTVVLERNEGSGTKYMKDRKSVIFNEISLPNGPSDALEVILRLEGVSNYVANINKSRRAFKPKQISNFVTFHYMAEGHQSRNLLAKVSLQITQKSNAILDEQQLVSLPAMAPS